MRTKQEIKKTAQSWMTAFAGIMFATGAFADMETTGAPGDPKDLSQVEASIPQVELAPIWSVSAQMPEVPSTLMVYETIPTDPTELSPLVQTIMDRFEFEPAETALDEDAEGVAAVLHTDQQNRTVEIFRSGASFYSEESLFPEQAPDLLETLQLDSAGAKEELANQATNLFDEIGLEGDGLYLKNVSFAQVKTVTEGSSQESVKTIGAAAHFGYELGGIPAWGPGAKTTVFFGADNGEGKVAGVYDAMPDVQELAEVDAIDPAIVVAEYIAADKPQSMLRLYNGVVDETVIEEVKLTYYVGPGNGDQAHVEPHYLITGTMYGWNPGPDPQNPREGATETEPTPFMWLEPARTPVPEPGLALGLALGALAVAKNPKSTRRH